MPFDYTASGQLTAYQTQSVVLIVNAMLLAAIAWAVIWSRAHAAHAKAASKSETLEVPSAHGEAVIRGVVETEEPERPAVSVSIWQIGTENEHKKSFTYVWKEMKRVVQAEPFCLLVESGARVRIEPGDDVFLVDALEVTERGNPRVRKAELRNGEKACVAGRFEHGYNPRTDARDAGGYRGAIPSGMVMKRGRDRMLVSTEPLALRYERQLTVHRRFIRILIGAWLAINVIFFGGAHLVNALGENVEATNLEKRMWITTNKNSKTTHYGISGEYTDAGSTTPVRIEDEVSVSAYYLVDQGTMKSMPFRVVRSWPYFHSVGHGGTMGVLRALLPLFCVNGLLVLYLVTVRRAREWYDQPKVIDTGAGHLVI